MVLFRINIILFKFINKTIKIKNSPTKSANKYICIISEVITQTEMVKCIKKGGILEEIGKYMGFGGYLGYFITITVGINYI